MSHRYKIVVEFETKQPLNEELLNSTADAMLVQLETLEDEEDIMVLKQDVKALPSIGTCMCRQYVNTGSCDHVPS